MYSVCVFLLMLHVQKINDSDETKASHVSANVPSYNRFYELKCM